MLPDDRTESILCPQAIIAALALTMTLAPVSAQGFKLYAPAQPVSRKEPATQRVAPATKVMQKQTLHSPAELTENTTAGSGTTSSGAGELTDDYDPEDPYATSAQIAAKKAARAAAAAKARGQGAAQTSTAPVQVAPQPTAIKAPEATASPQPSPVADEQPRAADTGTREVQQAAQGDAEGGDRKAEQARNKAGTPNSHVGANFTSPEELEEGKKKKIEAKKYHLPKVIPAPVHFKIVRSGHFATMTMPSDLLFINDHAVFAIQADKFLHELLPHIVVNRDHPLVLRVHSDNLGFDSYNIRLAQARGELLKQWLIKNGSLTDAEIEVEGVGPRRPVASNSLAGGVDNPQGRKLNRRVEFFIDTQVSLANRRSALQEEEMREAQAEADRTRENDQAVASERARHAGRTALQDASRESNRALPLELQALGDLKDADEESMQKAEEEASKVSENSNDRQNSNWDRVSNAQNDRKNLNAEGKRVVPAMTLEQKIQLQKDRDWARKEFGLFLEH